MFTIAAISDIHLEKNYLEKDFFKKINDNANLFIFGGDVGEGNKKYVERFIELISCVKVPILVALGNHDKFSKNCNKIENILLTNPLVKILDGDYIEYEFNGRKFGIVGLSGYGGGFPINENDDSRRLNELIAFQKKLNKPIPKYILDQMDWKKEYEEVEKIQVIKSEIKNKDPDVKIVVTHWAPFKELIEGEKEYLHPLLGSSKIGDEILKIEPDLVISGHSHHSAQGLKEIKSNTVACNVSYKVNDGKVCLFDIKDDEVSLHYL